MYSTGFTFRTKVEWGPLGKEEVTDAESFTVFVSGLTISDFGYSVKIKENKNGECKVDDQDTDMDNYDI